MKKIYSVLYSSIVLFLFSSNIYAQQFTTLADSLLFYYNMEGKIINQGSKKVKSEVHSAKKTYDKFGKSKSALEFYSQSGIYNRGLWIYEDINPSKYPMITITAWVQLANTSGSQKIMSSGNSAQTRGFGTTYEDGYTHWSANIGDSDPLLGSKVTGEWTFIAVLYNQLAEEIRFVVNNTLYSSKGKLKNGIDVITIGNFEGKVDEFRMYSRFLTPVELEQLYGSPMLFRDADLAVKERINYRVKHKQDDIAQLDSMPVRIVYTKELEVYDTLEAKNILFYVKTNDTITILSHDTKRAVIMYGNKKGTLNCTSIISNTYGVDESGIIVFAKKYLSNLFVYTEWASWVRFLTFAICMFLIFKYFYRIDALFARFNPYDEHAAGASKDGGYASVPKIPFLRRLFPIRFYPKWPLLLGIVLGISVVVFAVIDDSELEWFLNGGFSFIPSQDYYPIDWVLYGFSLFFVLAYVMLIIESIVIGGMWGGLLRIVFLTLFNCIAFIVTLYLIILIIVLVVAIIALSIFSSSAGGRYRCTRCGTIFYGNRCPYCG